MFWDIQKENSPLFLKPISKKRDGFNSAWSFPEHNQIVLTTMTVSQHLARFILLPQCWSTDEDHLTSSIHITKYATTLSAKSSMDNVCFLKLAVNKSACSVQLCLQTSILLQCLPLNVWCSVKKNYLGLRRKWWWHPTHCRWTTIYHTEPPLALITAVSQARWRPLLC